MRKNKNLLFVIAFLLSNSFLPLLIKPGLAGIPGTEPVSFWNPPSDQKENQDNRSRTRTRGGASRDGNSCDIAKTKAPTDLMTPLIPKSNIGLTQMGRPTLLVYLPKSNAKKALFTINNDETGEEHYQTYLTLPQKPGIMKINIPDSTSELVNKVKYQWSIALVCGENTDIEPDSPSIQGWIKRVSPISNTISQTQSLDLKSVEKLGRASLWFDMLSALMKLRQSQPKNMELKKTWTAVLEDKNVGLKEFAEQPFIN
ncbi:MAG: DUF928 domain-containing protein [Calothrix sp. MO_167.B42]|nr:DUF928 domain-containing protein [Calothrix sp. MO_167.B42]